MRTLLLVVLGLVVTLAGVYAGFAYLCGHNVFRDGWVKRIDP